MQIVDLTAYQFTPLVELDALRARLRAAAVRQQLKGTILLSAEGINLNVAGSATGIKAFTEVLNAEPAFGPFDFKYSVSDFIPFKRLTVKIKPEIITFNREDCSPLENQVPYLSAQEFKRWLDEGRDITVLDTRNRYEIEYGKFTKAIDLGIDEFTQLPDAAAQLPDTVKQKPLVMYCTGGVRCEKAGLALQKQGYSAVYQLQGGILKYFQECGAAHYSGDCFVFDERITVSPSSTITYRG